MKSIKEEALRHPDESLRRSAAFGMARISVKNRIDFFVKELSARKPSPGGGAAAALTGALGAALIVKVANFTIGKKRYRRYEKEVRVIAKRSAALKDKLCAHIEKDAKAYNQYAKTKSRASMRKASACAAEIARLSEEGLKLCARIRKTGNRNLKGDIMAAELFLRASAKTAGNLTNDG